MPPSAIPSLEAIAGEIDPAACDHVAMPGTHQNWRARWALARQAAQRVASLIQYPEGRIEPSQYVTLRSPAAALAEALAYHEMAPSEASAATLARAAHQVLQTIRDHDHPGPRPDQN
jgi:hypothetical protein